MKNKIDNIGSLHKLQILEKLEKTIGMIDDLCYIIPYIIYI